LFNILEHGRIAMELEEARILDAFAGTGALGLEALSRGAAHATFIENARVARQTLAENIASFDETARTTVLNVDATNPPPTDRAVDIAFLDPPYQAGRLEPALVALERRGWLGATTLIVAEFGSSESVTPPDFLEEIDRRKYGAAQVLFLVHRLRPQ
jgi:16S rRNA (guanine966-N2)-methyltransferase